MAINGLVLGGYDVFAGTTTGSTDVTYGGTYANLSEDTATSADAGTVTVTVTGDTVDEDTFGTYTVTYTAVDDFDADELVFTETVTVKAAAGSTLDTNFDAGNEDRTGTDTSGTAYDTIVDAAQGGTAPDAQKSAIFDGTALDPYEVKHSK